MTVVIFIYKTGRDYILVIPRLKTTKLIITESIIDAVSLLQQSAITNTYEILSLYGTNGLTQEHLQAIIALPHLQEIIFMLNADDAGKSGVQKQYSTLSNLLPGIAITNVELPEGEDETVFCKHMRIHKY